MNKVMYIYNGDVNVVISKYEVVEIYHYCVDKDVNVNIKLNGEYAKVIYHLGIISYRSIKCTVKVEHEFSNTYSEVICHGVNASNNELVFDVDGVVLNESSNCTCLEDNQIINLKDGKSVIKPNLYIRNYDTFSKHSAYIGNFNKDKIFYLMSRGINESVTKKMLVEHLLIGNGSIEEDVVKQFMKDIMEVFNG